MGGWRRAAPVTFGPVLADIPIAITLVFLMSQVPEEFLRFVMFAGAALLLYLAWDLWREMRKTNTDAVAKPKSQSVWRGLLQGALMIFLSPGSYLFWALVLGPLLLQALEQSWLHAVAFLGSFYAFSIGGLILIAVIIGQAGRLSASSRRWLQVSSLVLMLAMVFLLLYNGLAS
jgi:threonine/homoserine/homoserine lactone efflux protein